MHTQSSLATQSLVRLLLPISISKLIFDQNLVNNFVPITAPRLI